MSETAISKSYLQFDTRLMEETVLLAIAGYQEERRFRKERDGIYEIEDIDEREKRFEECHAAWFQYLRLDRPLLAALAEQSVLRERTRLCAVTPAASPRDEGADLYDGAASSAGTDSAKPAIAIMLRPATLLNTAFLLPFLRHELMHVADMLDPAFGYERSLPHSGFGSSRDNLVRERYTVLWNVWIDGRLRGRGLTCPVSRDKRRAQFLETFGWLGPAAENTFAALYDSVAQTHRGLMDLAQNPEAGLDCRPDAGHRTRHCSLCRFPAYHFADAVELPADALHEIASDYPDWRPEHGLCIQCADLYRSRSSGATGLEV